MPMGKQFEVAQVPFLRPGFWKGEVQAFWKEDAPLHRLGLCLYDCECSL